MQPHQVAALGVAVSPWQTCPERDRAIRHRGLCVDRSGAAVAEDLEGIAPSNRAAPRDFNHHRFHGSTPTIRAVGFTIGRSQKQFRLESIGPKVIPLADHAGVPSAGGPLGCEVNSATPDANDPIAEVILRIQPGDYRAPGHAR
jgi:hypothetical protein